MILGINTSRTRSGGAKAGYIEVPDAFMERINPLDHRLEITVRDGGAYHPQKRTIMCGY